MEAYPRIDPPESYATQVCDPLLSKQLAVVANLPGGELRIPADLPYGCDPVPFTISASGEQPTTLATFHVGCRSVVTPADFTVFDAIRLARDSFALVDYAGELSLQNLSALDMALAHAALNTNRQTLPPQGPFQVALGKTMLLSSDRLRPPNWPALDLLFSRAPTCPPIGRPYVLSVAPKPKI